MFKFVGPFTIDLSGQTGVGKTSFVRRLLAHKDEMFEPIPNEVLYCYSVYQDVFAEMERAMPFIRFHQGLPNENDINDFSDKTNKLLIVDDLMTKIVKSPDMEDLFTKNSHHKNISVCYINQNIFCPGRYSRTINLNTHYLLIMRNPRDVSTMKVLGRQLGIGNALHEAYMDVHKEPFKYLLVDLSPRSDDQFKLRTDIFPGEDTIVYKV